jgi:hypothetical protein
MDDDEERREAAASIRDSVRTLRDTPFGERLRDPDFRRQHAAGALLRNPDPVMREIGRQLQDGSMRPSDVLRIPEYREAFGRAAEQVRGRLDPQKVAADLAELAERSAKESR